MSRPGTSLLRRAAALPWLRRRGIASASPTTTTAKAARLIHRHYRRVSGCHECRAASRTPWRCNAARLHQAMAVESPGQAGRSSRVHAPAPIGRRRQGAGVRYLSAAGGSAVPAAEALAAVPRPRGRRCREQRAPRVRVATRRAVAAPTRARSGRANGWRPARASLAAHPPRARGSRAHPAARGAAHLLCCDFGRPQVPLRQRTAEPSVRRALRRQSDPPIRGRTAI